MTTHYSYDNIVLLMSQLKYITQSLSMSIHLFYSLSYKHINKLLLYCIDNIFNIINNTLKNNNKLINKSNFFVSYI